MKTIPSCSTLQSACRLMSSSEMSFSDSSSVRIGTASLSDISRFSIFWRPCIILSNLRMISFIGKPFPFAGSPCPLGLRSGTSTYGHRRPLSRVDSRPRGWPPCPAPRLDEPVVEVPHPQQLAERLAVVLDVGRADEAVEDALLHLGGHLVLDLLHRLHLRHRHARLHQVAHDLVDVLPHEANLGELGRLNLDEGGVRQLGEAPCNLRLPHPRRPDHQDVLRHDLLPQRRVDPLPPPPVPKRHGDGALGVILAHNVAVEIGDDLARTERPVLLRLLRSAVRRRRRGRRRAVHPLGAIPVRTGRWQSTADSCQGGGVGRAARGGRCASGFSSLAAASAGGSTSITCGCAEAAL